MEDHGQPEEPFVFGLKIAKSERKTVPQNEKSAPMPLADRVRKSEAKSIEAGAARMPGGLLPADAASALDQLLANGYSGSKVGVIAKALLDAQKKLKKKQ